MPRTIDSTSEAGVVDEQRRDRFGNPLAHEAPAKKHSRTALPNQAGDKELFASPNEQSATLAASSIVHEMSLWFT
jgi:hypothetical protein